MTDVTKIATCLDPGVRALTFSDDESKKLLTTAFETLQNSQ